MAMKTINHIVHVQASILLDKRSLLTKSRKYMRQLLNPSPWFPYYPSPKQIGMRRNSSYGQISVRSARVSR